MFEQVSLDLGGRKLTFETGKMARQAHGAVVARYGDTVVLATACMDNRASEKDSSPSRWITVNTPIRPGKFRVDFFKREGRPSEREILVSRLTDRPLRPLFPELGHGNADCRHGAIGRQRERSGCHRRHRLFGGALCLQVPLPFHNPIACVRVGLLEGQACREPHCRRTEEQLAEHRGRGH